ncbi:MAG: hypothetical protein Fur0021_38610 [Candidatus Promineifilaceae bacterium]
MTTLKKSYKLLLALLLAAIVAVGCTAAPGDEPGAIELTATPEIITLYVAAETAECVGVAPQTCLLVRTDPNGEWEMFYDTIEGFNYEAGYAYELRVNKIQVENPPADASAVKYELLEMVSKTAATETDSETTDALAGTKWTLTGMGPADNVVTPLPDNPIEVEFVDGQVVGTAGCNHFFASYTIPAAGEISIDAAGSTLMACLEEEVMARESQFLAALQAATGYELGDGALTILYEGGTLQFTTRIAPADLLLEGTEWQLTTFVSGEAASSLLADTQITAVFMQGQVSGMAGCNRYFGSYEIDGETLTISPLGSTRMACAEEIMAQESSFLAAMQTAKTFAIEGEQLTVMVDAGSLIFQGVEMPAEETADQISWEEALSLLNSGEVTAIFQAHSLSVTLTLQDGRTLHTVEPAIDDIFAAVEACGEPCAKITLATE